MTTALELCPVLSLQYNCLPVSWDLVNKMKILVGVIFGIVFFFVPQMVIRWTAWTQWAYRPSLLQMDPPHTSNMTPKLRFQTDRSWTDRWSSWRMALLPTFSMCRCLKQVKHKFLHPRYLSTENHILVVYWNTNCLNHTAIIYLEDIWMTLCWLIGQKAFIVIHLFVVVVVVVVGGDSLQLEDGQAVQLEDGTTAYIHTPKGL